MRKNPTHFLSANIRRVVRSLKEGILNRSIKVPLEAIRLAHENISASGKLPLGFVAR